MADNGTGGPLDILQGMNDAFNSISASLSCVKDALAELQRNQEHNELLFDSRGAFKGMHTKHFPENVFDTEDFQAIEIAGTCEHLPKWVDELWTARQETEAAIAKLPRSVKQLLTHHAGRPWVAMVRQECLDTLLVWPGEQIHHLAAEKLVSKVPRLLEQAAKRDPHEKWQYYLERLDYYRSNVMAIRDDVQNNSVEQQKPIENNESDTALGKAANVQRARHFLFMRCWPGFTDAFPYRDFDTVPDDEAVESVRHALALCLWNDRTAIRAKRNANYTRWLKAMKEQGRFVLGLQGSPRRPKMARQAWRRVRWGHSREDRNRRFVNLAALYGWHNHRGPMCGTVESLLFSHRIWLGEVDDADLAETLVTELARLQPNNDDEAKQREMLNPRFSVVVAETLSRGERASIQAAIERLRSGADTSDWANIARSYLPCVDSIVAAWNGAEVNQDRLRPAEADPCLPSRLQSDGEQPGDEREAEGSSGDEARKAAKGKTEPTTDGVRQTKKAIITETCPELPIVDEKLSQIRYDGETHPVRPEGARMVKLLVEDVGEWVSMEKNDFTKPSVVKRSLPKQIQSLIESEKGKGYRISRR